MEPEQFDLFRQLEQKILKLEYELIRLNESNRNLQRINGFIFGALLAEIIMMLYRGV